MEATPALIVIKGGRQDGHIIPLTPDALSDGAKMDALLREHFSGGQGGPPALIFMADEGGYLYDITQVSN